jgi:hypothetical protein
MARFGLFSGLAAAALAISLSGHGGAGKAGAPPDVLASPAAAGGRPAGALVVVFPSGRIAAIDVASGRRTVRRVPSVAACGPQSYVSGGNVIFGGVRASRTVVFSSSVSLDRPPKRLGRAHAFVPSATDGRVWLAGVDCNRRAMIGVREVTVDGRTTFASGRRVPRGWLAGAVEGGLVIERRRTVTVWDPRARGTGRRLPLEAVADIQGNKLLGCRRSRCRELLVLDAATAGEVRVRSMHRHKLDRGGRFSPDGSLLAAPAVADGRWSVALVNTRDGTTRIIPGSQTGRTYPAPRWAASSGWLFFRAGGMRVKAYRPGAQRAIMVPFRLPRRAPDFLAG